ncbi:MAG: 50S ribosomal protein L14 [Acidilobaceae archaeon]|nr:50S ribosomal protein L14 [Acidilobaceae archaeon]MCX8166053.1 50S ribosomal protein L14 [Acidilobaceae archaeon]MDW7974696.1 50S ribosomal protein L14 [Sulfolobales archaeon]
MKRKYELTSARPRVNAGLQAGSYVTVADNSGAKEVMIVNVPLVKTRLRRVPYGGVGDLVVASVKKGNPQMRRQIVYAVIVRQRRPFRRPDGTWVSFEDNAVVLINPDGTPRGSEVRGPIAREAAERWPKVAKLATIIV